MADVDLSYNQQLLLNVIPRITAGMSCCCALHMVVTILKSPFYRGRMYHRIMLGCAANIILLNIMQLWGPSAVPEGTEGFLGARGTTQTCSAQGFIYQLSFIVPSYYAALSLLSYLSMRQKFQVSNNQCIEKYIHIGVYIFPITSASYLLALEAYNPAVRDCYLMSMPRGCGGDPSSADYIECTRGPNNIGHLIKIFYALPAVLLVSIPTVVMIVLIYQLKSRYRSTRSNSSINAAQLVASSAAKQSGVYLAVIYWTYFFRALDAGLFMGAEISVFPINLLANSIEAMQGVWVWMAYWYFRTGDPTRTEESQNTPPRPNFSSSLGFTLQTMKPAFSIFDGGSIDADSPWSKFLADDQGEDEEYQKDCGEYTDKELGMEKSLSIHGSLCPHAEEVSAKSLSVYGNLSPHTEEESTSP